MRYLGFSAQVMLGRVIYVDCWLRLPGRTYVDCWLQLPGRTMVARHCLN